MEHKIPLSSKPGLVSGLHRKSNLFPALVAPHKEKSAREATERAKSDRIAMANLGIREPSRMQSRPFQPSAKQARREERRKQAGAIVRRPMYVGGSRIMKYELDAINVGDVVKVKGTVVKKYSGCMEIKTGDSTLQVIAVEEISDLMPAPFNVGDKVRRRGDMLGGSILTVVSIDGEQVWGKWPNGSNSTLDASSYKKVAA